MIINGRQGGFFYSYFNSLSSSNYFGCVTIDQSFTNTFDGEVKLTVSELAG